MRSKSDEFNFCRSSCFFLYFFRFLLSLYLFTSSKASLVHEDLGKLNSKSIVFTVLGRLANPASVIYPLLRKSIDDVPLGTFDRPKLVNWPLIVSAFIR